VADGTLNAACGGLVFLCYGRVEDLCDAIDDIGVLDGEQYCGAEVLIALFE